MTKCGGNLKNNGNELFSWEEDNLIPPEERWKYDPDYWADYKYNRDDFKKKKNLKKKFAASQTNLRTQLAQLLRNLTSLRLLKI